MYIATQLMGKSEKDELKEVFLALDKNGDGKLSREELIQGYIEMHLDPEEAAKQVDSIMSNVDLDQNGYVNYSGICLSHYRILVSI